MVAIGAKEALKGSFASSRSGTSFIKGTHGGKDQLALSTTGAIISLITLVIGAGVISLPNAVGGAGVVVGFGMVIFCGVIAIDSGRILCEAATLAEEQGHEVLCFEDIGFAAAGDWGRNVTLICMQVMYFLIACIFILLTGQYVGLIVDTAAGPFAPCAGVFPLAQSLNGSTFGGWILVAALALVPTLWLWDMSTVAKFAPAGVAGAIGLCVCLVVGSLIYVAEGLPKTDRTLLGPPDSSAVVGIFLKSIFSFAGVSAVPTMRNEMIEKEKLTGCVVKAMTFVTATYVIVAIPTILAFGQPQETLLGDVNIVLLYIGSAGIVVHVFIALPIVLNVLYNTMSLTVLPLMKTRSVMSLAIRFVVLGLAFLVPLVFGKLGALMDLVSALTMIATMILLPVVFNLRLQVKKQGSLRAAVRAIGGFAVAWQSVMMIVGIVAMVLGVISGVHELAAPASCPVRGL